MPKIVDHHRYRQELLSQCLSLFAEVGFRALTMRQIAANLGVSTGTLYHYFPNKESIFVQLVQEYCEKDVADFFAQAASETDLSTKLRRVIAFFMDNYSTYQQQMLIWVDFYQHCQQMNSQGSRVLHEFWTKTHQQLAGYLRLSPAQVDCFLTYLDGLLLQCLYGRQAADLQPQVEAFVTLFEQSCTLP
jgi:AcrR family transcriptional regulator